MEKHQITWQFYEDVYSGDTNFSGFPYDTPVKYPILWHPGARFNVQRESGMSSDLNKLASEKNTRGNGGCECNSLAGGWNEADALLLAEATKQKFWVPEDRK
ncbi:hypothetical protein C5167_020261 [Papaver somniferum]|uniref:Uncharacterized protein n=1 Tax=Papaver somniferum TaxID=3469 RepID=A0A4Y7IVV7_PAPSO|nr:hypothetical protein C5167_020261 [Papaver somniferum]